MKLIQGLIERHKRKIQERNDKCNNAINSIDTALHDADFIFSDPQIFIDPSIENEWKNRNADILETTKKQTFHHWKKATQYKTLVAKREELLHIARSMGEKIHSQNDRVANTKIKEAYALIGSVEGQKLDEQQMLCIVKESHNHLVIAGAGTGKTTTVVGKIKYLLKTGACFPQDILVLSFTNASAAEMKERIQRETGCSIAASTFHKFGMNIMTQVQGIKPKITQISLRKFVEEQLTQNMQSDAYLHLLSTYLLFNRVIAKSEFEFKSRKEYDEYLKLNPPTTLNNEAVKSYGEMDIANFLTQNGVQYIYEHPYEIDTRTSKFGQYHPDFYLPEYNIYIEYFGINRKGETPPYFQGSNGMSATESYRASMEWKRGIHRKHQTTMIECYAYEKMEGNLLDGLKKKLEAASVVLKPKAARELWAQISTESTFVLDGLVELFETLINLIKSNNYDIPAVRRLNQAGEHQQNTQILLSLLEPIFNAYCHYLSEHDEIDFNDMINTACEYVQQGKYINPYRYVIVDEYQDISKARYKLLFFLRQSNDYGLFCVGDDWQSIYRFAGSDVGLILNFSKYWGKTELSKIETTYRFPEKLIEISGAFIMKNPCQIKKSIRGMVPSTGFPLGEICGYTDRYAIKFMSQKIQELPKGSTVFLIGRYTFDVNLLKESEVFTYRYNNTSGLLDVAFQNRPDLKITFLTAHKSKGLQADYIFIINNKKSRMGFPSKIQEAPILDLLLDHCDQYPYAEERRLFYVALTRAKKQAFIVTVKGHESEFALELKGQYAQQMTKERYTCPLCGGRLVKRNGPYGDFWGCSNFSTRNCKFIRKISK